MSFLSKKSMCRSAIITAALTSLALPANAFEFSGDARFEGIEAFRVDPQYYASQQNDGRWLCEIQVAYEWDRDMSQPNIVKSIDGYAREDWNVPSDPDQRIVMLFNAARGERTRNYYEIDLFLTSWGPFQTGQTYSFSPDGEAATTNIEVTITAADLIDHEEFNTHCAN